MSGGTCSSAGRERFLYKLIEQFYKDNRETLLRTVRGRLDHDKDSEDLVQESFCRALKYSGSYKPSGGTLGAWIYRILYNLTTAYSMNRPDKHIDVRAGYEDEPVGMFFVDHLQWKRLKGLIESKSSSQADMLKLHILCGVRAVDVAKEYGVKANALRAMASRLKGDLCIS